MNNQPCAVKISIVALFVATMSARAVADIYVSRDANGKLVYSDREPAGPHKHIRVDERTVPSRSASSVSTDQAALWEQAAKDREERARNAELERKAAEEERARRCSQARRENAIYGVDGRKCDYDSDGNRRCLSSVEIDSKRAEAKRLMADNCNRP
jgi:hypothetical protein